MLSEIQGPDPLDGRSDLLAVCADILHWGSAHSARNSCEAFDSGTVFIHCVLDEFVPILAGRDFEHDLSIWTSALIDPEQSDLHNQTAEPRVGDK